MKNRQLKILMLPAYRFLNYSQRAESAHFSKATLQINSGQFISIQFKKCKRPGRIVFFRAQLSANRCKFSAEREGNGLRQLYIDYQILVGLLVTRSRIWRLTKNGCNFITTKVRINGWNCANFVVVSVW